QPGPGAAAEEPDLSGRAGLRGAGLRHPAVHLQPVTDVLAARARPPLLRAGAAFEARGSLTRRAPARYPLSAASPTEEPSPTGGLLAFARSAGGTSIPVRDRRVSAPLPG